MKKILAIAISFILLFALVLTPASAATEGVFSLNNAEGAKGDNVTLNINISDNPGLITMRFNISWSQGLELVSVSDTGVLKGYTTPSPTISSPYTLRWGDSLATENNTVNGKIAVLTFKIKEGASIGDETVNLTFIESRSSDGNENEFKNTSAKISVVCKNHSYGDYEIESANKHSRTCSICGFVDSANHTWKDGNIIKTATCKETGSKQVNCTVCSATKVEEIAKSKSHTFDSWSRTKEPTCTEKGLEVRTCSVCEISLSKTIDALGHQLQNTTVTREPTCSRAGSKTGNCTRCNKQVSVEIPKTEHSFGEWEVKKAATCTEKGLNERKCATCSKTEKQDIELLGHSYNEHKIIVEATISSTGIKEAKCNNCDKVVKEVVPCSVSDEATNIYFETSEGVFLEGTEIKVAEITKTNSDYSTAKVALTGVSQQFKLFNINAYLKGKSIQPNGEVVVTFAIPQEYGKNVAIYNITEDGNKELVQSVISEDGKTVSVTLSHFSLYALCNTIAKSGATGFDEDVEDDGNTGAIIIFVIVIALVIGLSAAILIYKKRTTYLSD